MKDGLFAPEDPQTEYFSRSDATQVLGSFSAHGFLLDGQQWPSVEHYYQAMKFTDASYQEKIRLATSPAMARKLGEMQARMMQIDSLGERVGGLAGLKPEQMKATEVPGSGGVLVASLGSVPAWAS